MGRKSRRVEVIRGSNFVSSGTRRNSHRNSSGKPRRIRTFEDVSKVVAGVRKAENARVSSRVKTKENLGAVLKAIGSAQAVAARPSIRTKDDAARVLRAANRTKIAEEGRRITDLSDFSRAVSAAVLAETERARPKPQTLEGLSRQLRRLHKEDLAKSRVPPEIMARMGRGLSAEPLIKKRGKLEPRVAEALGRSFRHMGLNNQELTKRIAKEMNLKPQTILRYLNAAWEAGYRSPLDLLTERERSIFELRNLGPEQIARELSRKEGKSISVSTVERRIRDIFRKLHLPLA